MASIRRRKNRINEFSSGLKINSILQNFTDCVSDKCLQEVIELFGGSKSILLFIFKHANINTLNKIYEITIKYKNRDQKNNILNYFQFETKKFNKINSDNIWDNKKNLFKTLPNDCISNICNYLTKEEINEFKICSRIIAIVCFNEMNKMSIGIITSHKIISKHYMNYFHFYQTEYEFIEYTRHKLSKKMHILQEEWAVTHKIATQNQLLFERKYSYFPYQMFALEKNKDLQIVSAGKQTDSLLIDSSKLVILTENESRLFDLKRDTLYDFQLIILQYFDIKQQLFVFSQFILYYPNVTYDRLFEYIENEYIIINGIDNKWYFELNNILKEMN
eukprot:84620_1